MKTLHIKTYGCQMNVYDSAKMRDMLLHDGFSLVETPNEAEVVILNTCHIRHKASEKVYSELGILSQIKRSRIQTGLNMIIIVAGCTGQAEGKQVFKRAPCVDIVVGPQSYHNIPSLISEIYNSQSHLINIKLNERSKFQYFKKHGEEYSSFLSVQEGCDKFCHYCVVPYTRGREYSRDVSDIYDEATDLVENNNVKEITLLGQNVSAYHGKGPDESEWSLGKLIMYLAKIDGLERIRYTTSHPSDMENSDLLEAHANEKKLMPFVHLPVQSGSNKVLRSMNRRYTAECYISIVENLRKANKDIAFSSDFIVGYPEETEEDFLETLNLIKTIEFASAYSFKYSVRPRTPAAKMDNQIHEDIKSERLIRLQNLLKKQQKAFNASKVSQNIPVLVTSNGKKDNQMLGKSPYMQSVIIENISNDINNSIKGELVSVKIESASLNSLKGQINDK